jgi:hypothetical protein
LEKYTQQTTIDGNKMDLPDKSKLRISIRPKIKQRIAPKVFFEHVTFFQPNIRDFSDYYLESVTSINIATSKWIELAFSYEYNYLSQPISDAVKKTDQVLLARLTFMF